MNPLKENTAEEHLLAPFESLAPLSVKATWEEALLMKLAHSDQSKKAPHTLWQPVLIAMVLLVNLSLAFSYFTHESHEPDQRKAALQLVSKELLFDNSQSNN